MKNLSRAIFTCLTVTLTCTVFTPRAASAFEEDFSTGAEARWEIAGGSGWSFNDGELRQEETSWHPLLLVRDFTLDEGYIELTFTPEKGSNSWSRAGIVFGYREGEYYSYELLPERDRVNIFHRGPDRKRVPVGDKQGVELGESYTLGIELGATKVRCFLNGELLQERGDIAPPAGRVGIYMGNVSGTVQTFKAVENADAPAPGQQVQDDDAGLRGGFEENFSKSLSNWEVAGGKKWSIEDGVLHQDESSWEPKLLVRMPAVRAGRISMQFRITQALTKWGQASLVFGHHDGAEWRVALLPGQDAIRVYHETGDGKKKDAAWPRSVGYEAGQTHRLTAVFSPDSLTVSLDGRQLVSEKGISVSKGRIGMAFGMVKAEIDAFSYTASRASGPLSQRRVKQTFESAGARQTPMRWYDFVGSHYHPDVEHKRVGALRGFPFRAWSVEAEVDPSVEEAHHATGAFSGQERAYNFQRIDEALARLRNEAPNVSLILPQAGYSNLDRYEEPTWKAKIARFKDLVYEQAHYFATGQHADQPILYYQAGNEVNSLGFFNPHHTRPGQGETIWDYFNREDRAVEYAEELLAPAAEAIEKASRDVFGDPDRIKVVLGSAANSFNPDTLTWLDAVLNHEFTGKYAPSLKGQKAWKHVDVIAIHYILNGGATGYNMKKHLNSIHEDYLASGKVEGLWSTEEHGTAGAGVIDAAITIPRYFDWWLAHDWSLNRGRMFFWSDWTSRIGFPAVYIEQLYGDFLKNHPFVSVTGDVTVTGSGNLEAHAFRADEPDGARSYLVVVTSKGNVPWLDERYGEAFINAVRLDTEEGRGELRASAVLVDHPTGLSKLSHDYETEGQTAVFKLDKLLEPTRKATVALFLTSSAEDKGLAFADRIDFRSQAIALTDKSEMITMKYGNGITGHGQEGIDQGMQGDHATIVANRRNDHNPSLGVVLGTDYSRFGRVKLEVDVYAGVRRGESLPERVGDFLWDGEAVLDLDINPDHLAKTNHFRRVYEVVLPTSAIDVSAGAHTVGMKTGTEFFDVQIDAIRITGLER